MSDRDRTTTLPRGCEVARRLASDDLDGALPADDERRLSHHLETCTDCAAFRAELDRLRTRLRLGAVGDPPDLATGVRSRLEEGRVTTIRRRRRGVVVAAQAAAVFAVAFAVGALVAALSGAPRVAVADVPGRIAEAQARVSGLSARFEIVERGWHQEVAERRFSGHLAYAAPETLVVRIADDTSYPGPQWVANDVDVVIADDVAWASGPPPCPTASLPACTPQRPRVTAVANRPPFAESAVPLDIVVPVRSFTDAAPPREIGRSEVAGRRALGLVVTVAQVEPLLDAVTGAGNWRELHPADEVELWLDEEMLVPLAFAVRAGEGPERDRWATVGGYDDPAGAVIWELRLTEVALNEDAAAPAPPPRPAGASPRDAGFHATDRVDAPYPARLPDGMVPYRAGVLAPPGAPEVAVLTWSDGRAWVRLRATRQWGGGRLFGDLGAVVRRIALPGGGVAYVGERGDRVALHVRELDVVVEGTVGLDTLVEITASLGLEGHDVPAGWREAGATSLTEAARALPGLLVPSGMDGFGEPGVQVDADTIVLGFHGPGTRAFTLTQGPGAVLSPPLDADVRGVAVRGTTARYTPARGELEWVEDGRTVSLRSATLSLEELAGIASLLTPHVAEANGL